MCYRACPPLAQGAQPALTPRACLQDWKPNEYVRWYIDGQPVYGGLLQQGCSRHLRGGASPAWHRSVRSRVRLLSASALRPPAAEVNKEALRAQGNGTYETFERLIPVEPM